MSNHPRIVILALALAAFAPASLAQEPQDETPSLTTEDIHGPAPIVTRPEAGPVAVVPGGGPTLPTVDELWQEIYRGLAREGMPSADVDQFRSIIEAGGEVSIAIRFDVDGRGRMVNFAVRRQSGIGWIDNRLGTEAPPGPMGADFANYSDVDVDLGVSRGRLRVSAAATAPSIEKAEQVEQVARAFSAGGPHTPAIPGVTISRSGATLNLSIDLSFDEILGRR